MKKDKKKELDEIVGVILHYTVFGILSFICGVNVFIYSNVFMKLQTTNSLYLLLGNFLVLAVLTFMYFDVKGTK